MSCQDNLSLIEDRYHRLVTRMPALIFELDASGKTLFVSESSLLILGYAPEELVGMDWFFRLFPGKHLMGAFALFRRLEISDVDGFEIEVIAKNGSEVTLEMTTANQYDPNGLLVRIFGIAIDRTQREQDNNSLVEANQRLESRAEVHQELERELQRLVQELQQTTRDAEYEKARWKATVDSMTDPVQVCDATGHVFYVNEAFRWICRYDPETGLPTLDEEKGLHYTDIIDQHGRKVTAADFPINRAIAENRPILNETSIQRTPHGTEMVVVWNVSPLYDADGNLMGAVGVAQNITEQRARERERERLLQEAERRAAELDAIINAITDGVIIYDQRGEIVSSNPAAIEMLGLPLDTGEEPLSIHTCILTAEGRALEADECPIARVQRGGEPLQGMICVYPRIDQRDIWMSLSAAPIKATDGQMLGIVMTITDITDLHEFEEQRELFVHTVSHDLRTPLTVISGHTQILLSLASNLNADEKMLQSLRAIRRGVRRMNVMIQDLADSARKASGQLDMRFEAICLQTYLDELLHRNSTALEIERIVTVLPPDVPKVHADPDRLERILTNLLSNALKYSPADKQVMLRAQCTGDEVHVSVSDEGDGIAEDEIPRVFDRFFRAKGSVRWAEGLGLGLYITKSFVEAHGGRIWVDSTPGQGSTFTFSLPVQ